MKALKDLVVSGGFMATKVQVPVMSPSHKEGGVTGGENEDNIANVQDGLADLKRAVTEVVECWNIL